MMKNLLALLFSCVAVGQALALEPDRRETTVINGRVWDGFSYKETLLPSTLDTLYLMSEKDSAISFVRTEEYYWPLSRQVYVDFEKRREELNGVLRIDQDGITVAEIAPSDYAIVYPDGVVNGNGSLLWEAEASGAYATYQAEEKDFARRYVEAQAQQTAYERKLVEAGAKRLGRAPSVVGPTPPQLPQPSLRLVTKPVSGYRLALAPGRYDLALYLDGRLVAGTRRRLEVIDVGKRQAVVADIVPEERWTRPLAANSEASRVYARPGSVFYVMLQDADRFDEAEYLSVVAPQQEPVRGRITWVRRKPVENSKLSVSWDGPPGTVEMDLSNLKVEQTEGSGFGYRVRAAKPGEKEDLTAFTVAVPPENERRRGEIRTEAGGGFLRRDIIIVQKRQAGLAFGLAILPASCWLAAALLRRRSHWVRKD
ncbi:hypothetical protein [Ensifer sp. YR511]|uniref:hypothetical protein n=1 Tax=Ensifer sp. YR511 TaxID=1855294 RepID=UPI000881A980|nr:hypothetical protein [Ensifer sp. YR511]SDN03844.1 hypothetical protein SAMN05216328_11763 [Ensifer sp. YR511]